MSRDDPASLAVDLYDRDLVLWSAHQARLLAERRFDELDLINLVDEVRSLGTSEQREIRRRLAVLTMLLLRWRYQPGRRTQNLRGTIDDQRGKIEAVLDDSPTLRSALPEAFAGAFLSARLKASKETGIDFTLFPAIAPFTIDEVLDPDFLPKHPDLDDQTT